MAANYVSNIAQVGQPLVIGLSAVCGGESGYQVILQPTLCYFYEGGYYAPQGYRTNMTAEEVSDYVSQAAALGHFYTITDWPTYPGLTEQFARNCISDASGPTKIYQMGSFCVSAGECRDWLLARGIDPPPYKQSQSPFMGKRRW